MTLGGDVRRWAAVSAAALLIGVGLLTRASCAPAAPPAARAPAKPVDARTDEAMVGASENEATSAVTEARSTRGPGVHEQPPHVVAVSDAPFTTGFRSDARDQNTRPSVRARR